MASVEEAEAYAQRHQVAERLEAAVNACLAELPAEPFGFMAKHLTAGADAPPAERVSK